MRVPTNDIGVDAGWVGSILLFLFLISLIITALRYGPAIMDNIACYLCTHFVMPLEKKLLEDLENNPCWISNPIQPLAGFLPMPVPAPVIFRTEMDTRLIHRGKQLPW